MSAVITPALLVTLARYPRWPKTAADIVRLIGRDAAARLFTRFRGQEIPVPMVVGGGNPAGEIRYAALAEIVGENAAEQMVRYWGGQNLNVPTLKQEMSDWMADEIRAGFDVLTAQGYSSRDAVFELGLKYGCSGRWVEKILGRPDTVTAADAHQGRLF